MLFYTTFEGVTSLLSLCLCVPYHGLILLITLLMEPKPAKKKRTLIYHSPTLSFPRQTSFIDKHGAISGKVHSLAGVPAIYRPLQRGSGVLGRKVASSAEHLNLSRLLLFCCLTIVDQWDLLAATL